MLHYLWQSCSGFHISILQPCWKSDGRRQVTQDLVNCKCPWDGLAHRHSPTRLMHEAWPLGWCTRGPMELCQHEPSSSGETEQRNESRDIQILPIQKNSNWSLTCLTYSVSIDLQVLTDMHYKITVHFHRLLKNLQNTHFNASSCKSTKIELSECVYSYVVINQVVKSGTLALFNCNLPRRHHK